MSRKVERTANCVIPNTELALQLIQQRVKAELGPPNRGTGDGGSMGTLAAGNCYTTSYGAYCEELVVNPPPGTCSSSAYDPGCGDPYAYCAYDQYAYGCPGSPCYSNNTLDLCRDPCYIYYNCTVSYTPTSTSSPYADDQTTACHLANSGNCNVQPATPAQQQKARDLMRNIRDEDICLQAKIVAGNVVNADPTRLGVWTNEVKQDGKVLLGDQGWTYVDGVRVPTIHVYDSYDGFTAWTLEHEALHALGYQHEDYIFTPDNVLRTMDQAARWCARA